MFPVEPTKLITLFIKIPCALIAMVIAFRIKKLSNYILNKLFFYAYFAWGITIGLDALLFVIAPIDPILFQIANILRDIDLLVYCITPFMLHLSSYVINDGEEIGLMANKKRLIIPLILYAVIATGVILNDRIVVENINTGATIDPSMLPVDFFMVPFKVKFNQNLFAYVFYICFVLWFFYAVSGMFSFQKQLSGMKKTRARQIMWGALCIPLGILYFIFVAFFKVSTEINIILMIIGQLIYLSAPILTFLGMRIQVSPKIEA